MLTQRLSLNKAPVIRVKPPGPKSMEILSIQDKLESSTRSYTRFFKMAIDYAKGSTIVDVDGNVYIDWFGGVSVMNLGHGNPIVIRAIEDQLNKITHITELPTEARISYLKNLNATLPGKMKDHSKVLFTVSGADACEAAISLARYITKRRTIIAFSGSYHGIAGGVVHATANPHYREYASFNPHEVYFAPFPYPYRFPIKGDDISKVVIDYLDHMISDPYSGISKPAGIMVEPIQGEGGYVVPPDDFLPMLRELADKHSIPLIVDEVQTGVGRTGKIWASDLYGITPDIMCVSKSIGGGIPISSVVYREEYDNLPTAFHLGTYRGNPLGLAAGAAILEYLMKGNLLDRVTKYGRNILSRFQDMMNEYGVIGDVRGKGFMIGVELVKNGTTLPNQEIAQKLRDALFQNGLLMHTCGHYGNVMRFMAPLTIEDDLIDNGLEIFESSIREMIK